MLSWREYEQSLWDNIDPRLLAVILIGQVTTTDSLPDLDDWGVTTSTTVAEDRIEISPIFGRWSQTIAEPTVRVDNDQEKREVNAAPTVDVVPQIEDKAPPQNEKVEIKAFSEGFASRLQGGSLSKINEFYGHYRTHYLRT